jgi:hypothetical protein
MADLTGSLKVIATYYYDLLNANATTLGLKAVYYGDQDHIPVSPVVCVEPEGKNRTLVRIGRGTDVEFSLYLLVYGASIRDPQTNRSDIDDLAERIEALIHQNERLDGLVVTSLVTRVESGYATKSNAIMRASRLTIEARSQERLPTEV